MGARTKKARKRLERFLVNDIPTRIINYSYDYYSMIGQGQLRLGLPVSRDLIKTQEEIRSSAAGKLALTLYHIFFRATGSRIPRLEIKLALLEELQKGSIKLTENVIILTREQLKHLSRNCFQIPDEFFPAIYDDARRRRILRESLQKMRMPAYFESEIEEREANGRGDYEIVYYRDYTNEGKEIRFRRLLSMEEVTGGDDRPSVVLVPGFANNSNCFNLNNHYSMAKDMADLGYWVYLFDPRGMGVNEGKFDPLYTVDTLIDYDLATVVRFISHRSKGKPVILTGHSMGGIVSENMVLLWSLRRKLDTLCQKGSDEYRVLDKILPPKEEAEENLSMVRAVVSLGSPKFFDRDSHVVYPTVLWLNHLAKILKFRVVPIREIFWFLLTPPGVRFLGRKALRGNLGGINFLINNLNHIGNPKFAHDYVDTALENVPLGLGFQFLKAIYNGEGFKRMDESRLNYSENLIHFPENIPVFHFYGSEDPLAPPTNLRYSEYYPHRHKRVFHIQGPEDLNRIEISSERSQVTDFVIEGANHIDLLYGKVAREVISPLVRRIVHTAWGGWTYAQGAKSDFAEKPVRAVS
ncbi:MAG: alpha/beta fold hydrolase [Thermodesulfobacteriota bacterium]